MMNNWWNRLRIEDYVLVNWGSFVSSNQIEQLKIIGRSIIDNQVHIVVKCPNGPTRGVGYFAPEQAESLGIHPVYRKLNCWRFPENDPRVSPIPTFPYADQDTYKSLDRKHRTMPSVFKRLREALTK